jgi:phage tail-like protein
MTMSPPPVRYALARSRQSWPEVALAGLEPDPGGDLRLLRLPGVAPPSIAAPADLGASGLALDCECGLYVADTAGDRIVRVGLDCPTELALPGVPAPRGLCVGRHGWLFVACGDGRIRVFTTPGLSLRGELSGFQQPIALACHGGDIVVVDGGSKRVLRTSATGVPDAAFDAAVTSPADPRTVAVGRDGTIYVGGAGGGGVERFEWSGAPAGPALAAGTEPRALAVLDDVLYVGDALSGHVLVYALPDGTLLGAVGGYEGPVTALAVDAASLYVKTGLDSAYVVATPASWHVPSGTLVMEALDAGLEVGWARAAARCVLPPGTDVALEWYTDDTPTPAVVDWRPSPSLDLLLPAQRYLWLRVTLSTSVPPSSPTLLQLEAQTTGDSYLQYLPYVYTHDPDRPGLYSEPLLESIDPTEFEPGDLEYLRSAYARTPVETGFVARLLDLTRSELGDLEHAIADLPTLFDPETAPASLLGWLAGWLAFELPPRLLDGTKPDEIRQLLLGLAALYRHRGTPRGIADFVEVYAGLRPRLFEEFEARPLWLVGVTPLGFGTGLADRDLEGLMVGESVVGETGPEDPDTFGAAAFASTAHRFSVIVPAAARVDEATRGLITSVVEAERPAHTAFHLCFIDPRLRVGLQARIGLDTVVALEPEPLALDERSVVGLDLRLSGPAAGDPGAVGTHDQLGLDTRLG